MQDSAALASNEKLISKSYKLRTASMHHQRVGLKRALNQPTAFAYLAETGTGKSHMLLSEFQHRINIDDVTDLLVIAPAGCLQNWYADKGDEPSELKKHLDPKLFDKLLIATNRKNAENRARQKLMLKAETHRALFVNIEALSHGDQNHPSDAEILCRQLLTSGRCMMVVDESTRIKSRSAARTKTVLRLGKLAHCRRILTGLVTPKSPLDLYSQMNFLDPKILDAPSFVAFRARYAKMKVICREPEAIVNMRLRQIMLRRRAKFSTSHMSYYEKVNMIITLGGWIQHIPIIDDYQNLDELQRKIAPYSYQILKKDCLDLKPKTYQFRYVEMNPQQKRVYNEVLNDATSKLDNGEFITANSVIGQMIRLHQIVCGHVRDEEGQLHDLDNNRISALIDILDEHEGKAIIWITYDFELRRIAKALLAEYGAGSVATFWGGNAKSRHQDEARFLSDPKCRFMVSTQMSGGYGNTWNVATLVVYAANNHNLEHRYQSEDRCHRIGQENKVTYIDLMSVDTVEEKIIKALRKKIDLNSAITGENYREWLI